MLDAIMAYSTCMDARLPAPSAALRASCACAAFLLLAIAICNDALFRHPLVFVRAPRN